MAKPDISPTQGVIPESWRTLAGLTISHGDREVDGFYGGWAAAATQLVSPQDYDYLPPSAVEALDNLAQRRADAVRLQAESKLADQRLAEHDRGQVAAEVARMREGAPDAPAKAKAGDDKDRQALINAAHAARTKAEASKALVTEAEDALAVTFDNVCAEYGFEPGAIKAYDKGSEKIRRARGLLQNARELRDEAAHLIELGLNLGALPYPSQGGNQDPSAWERQSELAADLDALEHSAPLPVLRERPELRLDLTRGEEAEGDFDVEALRRYDD